MPTNTITVQPNKPTATLIIGAGSGPHLITNLDTINTVFLGDANSIQSTDPNVIPLRAGASVAVDGRNDLFGVTTGNQTVSVSALLGGLSAFLPVSFAGGILSIPGFLIYANNNPAAGNLIESVGFATATTDAFGDAVQAGDTVYALGNVARYVQMEPGAVGVPPAINISTGDVAQSVPAQFLSGILNGPGGGRQLQAQLQAPQVAGQPPFLAEIILTSPSVDLVTNPISVFIAAGSSIANQSTIFVKPLEIDFLSQELTLDNPAVLNNAGGPALISSPAGGVLELDSPRQGNTSDTRGGLQARSNNSNGGLGPSVELINGSVLTSNTGTVGVGGNMTATGTISAVNSSWVTGVTLLNGWTGTLEYKIEEVNNKVTYNGIITAPVGVANPSIPFTFPVHPASVTQYGNAVEDPGGAHLGQALICQVPSSGSLTLFDATAGESTRVWGQFATDL